MPYTVHFIGLTCFVPDGAGKRAYMPDGRIPPPDTQVHTALISIPTAAIRSSTGWDPHEVSTSAAATEFLLSPSEIELSSIGGQPLDAGDLDGNVIRLRDIDAGFRLSANPEWIVLVTLRYGTLKARRANGYPDDGSAQFVGEWIVPHDDKTQIVVNVTPRRGWPLRTIVVDPQTEIAIVNSSHGLPELPGDHFRLYERLSGAPVVLKRPPKNKTGVPGVVSRHPAFEYAMPASGSLSCSPVNGG
jgi:hypothetical protein